MATYLGHFEDSYGNVVLPTPHSYTSVIETTMTASQAYKTGQIITLTIPSGINHLYKAKTNIARNATFVVGSNIESWEVSNLNQKLVASNGMKFTLQKYMNGDYT